MNDLNSSITKLSYVRGIGEYLQQHGVVKFASVNVLRHACDRVTDAMLAIDPVKVASDGSAERQQPSFEEIRDIAQTLVKMSQYLEGQGKTASDPTTVSIATEEEAYGDLLRKVAAATTIGVGPDPKNTQPEAAAVTDEAKLENTRRPVNYAVVGQGNANFSEPQKSRTGTEQPQADLDIKKNPGTSNSVIQATKAAKANTILSALQKLSAPLGSTIDGDSPEQQNKMENSPQGETIMEATDRPEGYAVVGVGNANIREVTDARTGVEQPHPTQPTDGGVATNSVIEATKAAEMRVIANTLMPILPSGMSPEEKIATVSHCADLDPSLREHYVREVLSR